MKYVIDQMKAGQPPSLGWKIVINSLQFVAGVLEPARPLVQGVDLDVEYYDSLNKLSQINQNTFNPGYAIVNPDLTLNYRGIGATVSTVGIPIGMSGIFKKLPPGSKINRDGSVEIPLNQADNVVNAIRLREQLVFQSAESLFNADGTIVKSVIDGADRIIPENRLNNPNIPKGYSKYSTKTFHSPSGDFQIHFYKNDKTGEVYYGLDYKVVFNKPSKK